MKLRQLFAKGLNKTKQQVRKVLILGAKRDHKISMRLKSAARKHAQASAKGDYYMWTPGAVDAALKDQAKSVNLSLRAIDYSNSSKDLRTIASKLKSKRKIKP